MNSPQGPTWSDIADWYDDLLASGSGPHQTALECLGRLLPDVEGSRVIDVACGHGLASRFLAGRGAHVVGIDLSEPMIEIARGRGTPDGPEIEYRVDDAETLQTVADRTFDGAVCILGLMDIADFDASLAAIHRVLRPAGWFVFVIGHPCFLVPNAHKTETPTGPGLTVTGYFEERFWRSSNPEGVRRAGNHHRMLSSYLNAVTGAGFVLEATEEPRANDLLAEQHPVYREIPIFFAAKVRCQG